MWSKLAKSNSKKEHGQTAQQQQQQQQQQRQETGQGTSVAPSAALNLSPTQANSHHLPTKPTPIPSTTDADGPAAPSSHPTNPPHKHRSGMLTVKLVEGRNFVVPKEVVLPPAIARAVQSSYSPNDQAASSSSGGGSGMSPKTSGMAGVTSSTAKRGRGAAARYLPYALVEFDKNEVLIDAIGGELSTPVWQYKANFDVSRESHISIQVYLRAMGPAASSGSAAKDQGTDLYLGGVKVGPSFESRRGVTDEWVPLSGGTGKGGQGGSGHVRVQVSFQVNDKGLPVSIEAFDLLKVIGKGSFGKVMQVRKRDTQRIYAMKTIRKAHIVSRSEVTHTLAERTVLAKVNNPFIVNLKFSFQSPEKLYLVLAFVNGGELFHHLQHEGRFSEERSRFYTAELLSALECLHGFNVIYRDLKPENILLDYTGHIALCDFGLCKLNMSNEETTNTFCGTPEYLAPELLLGHGYNRTVDWWTLGVLLYEMLSGLPPFYDENTNDMYRKILQDPLRFPEDMRSDAVDILKGLLTRDPTKRLGVGGAEDIKRHPFFARHIDWKKLMQKRVQPPFKPSVASAIDTSNFDPEFTDELPLDSVVDDSHLSETVQQQFQGFSYSGEGRMGQSLGPGSMMG